MHHRLWRRPLSSPEHLNRTARDERAPKPSPHWALVSLTSSASTSHLLHYSPPRRPRRSPPSNEPLTSALSASDLIAHPSWGRRTLFPPTRHGKNATTAIIPARSQIWKGDSFNPVLPQRTTRALEAASLLQLSSSKTPQSPTLAPHRKYMLRPHRWRLQLQHPALEVRRRNVQRLHFLNHPSNLP